jgi:hypothetical protein
MTPHQITIAIPAAGTPVQVSATKLQCSSIFFINRIGDVITVGIAGLNKATGAGVIADVPPAATGSELGSNILKLPFNPMAENPYDLRDYWLDSAVNGDICDVVYWTL